MKENKKTSAFSSTFFVDEHWCTSFWIAFLLRGFVPTYRWRLSACIKCDDPSYRPDSGDI
ncbi:hypothetical protein VCHENC01_3874 [Vibrio harveyi]|nr:hypothetical protein VCHENC01_3874 [Vibrio harveyi]